MAGFASGSGSDYAYGLTAPDEKLLSSIVGRLSPVSLRPLAPPGSSGPRSKAATLARNAIPYSSLSSNLDPDARLAIEDTIAAITDDDLTFDISELDQHVAAGDAQGSAHADGLLRPGTVESQNRRLAPSVSGGGSDLSSFVSKTKPRSLPTLLAGPDVRYPDLSRALADTQQAADSLGQPASDDGPPLLRFRTFPRKPLSVSDLTAGSWCELQYFYTLTRLPGGRKTRTTAMKRGSDVHEKLEREVFAPIQIDIAKKEDTFGLKIWNIIQGLRVLRDQGFTREMEVWGMVEGNVVNGVIDGLSYENPDPELQEDIIGSRGSSQAVTNSRPSESGAQGDRQIFITDVKTRNSASPPPQAQVRGSIIQLFLYHRFLSQMAAGKLDYIHVFERYGLNLDEPFSDSFMAQIGAIHDEVFAEADSVSAPTFNDTIDAESTADASANTTSLSAPSNPSQVSFLHDSSQQPNLNYRTLRSLLPLLNFELHLTFPRGAADLGKIVAVEYRYRGHDLPPTANATDPVSGADLDRDLGPSGGRRMRREYEPGGVICVNSFVVEPEMLDLYLAETMRWWKGEREPRGVAVDETFKCRSCEFIDDCEWRRRFDQEGLRKARRRQKEREKAKEAEVEAEVELDVGIEEAGKSGRGRRKKAGAGASVSV